MEAASTVLGLLVLAAIVVAGYRRNMRKLRDRESEVDSS